MQWKREDENKKQKDMEQTSLMIAYPTGSSIFLSSHCHIPPDRDLHTMASTSGGDDNGDGGGRPQRQRHPSAKARDMEGIDLNRIIESLSKGTYMGACLCVRA